MKQLKFKANALKVAMLLSCSLSAFSCVSNLKPYQRVYLNDPEMDLGNDVGKNYRNYINTIREGATPAGTDKASGGCGCN